MDMHISGAGRIAPGEYENIHISGSGKFCGLVRCTSLHTAGACHGESLDCSGQTKTAGSCSFSDDVFSNKLQCSGSFSCGGSIRSNSLSVCGAASVKGDITAETATVIGAIKCKGLLNAETVQIKSDGFCHIGSIGGSNVHIRPQHSSSVLHRIPLLTSLFREKWQKIQIENHIEADVIDLVNVSAPRVSGRIVAIGEDCEIDLVQYSEQIEISPKAKVGRTEKI